MGVLVAITLADTLLTFAAMSAWSSFDTWAEITTAHKNARNACRSNKRLLEMKGVLQGILSGDDITLNKLDQLIIDWGIYSENLRYELSVTRESYRNRLVLLLSMVSLIIIGLTAKIYRN